MNRIRMIDVNDAIYRLNMALDRPTQAWSDRQANIGNYHLYSACGGYSLHVICNQQGGVHSLVTGTLREVHLYVRGMIHAAYELKETQNA